MNKEQCLEKLDEITSIGLLSAVVFFKSPFGVEERHIWSNTNSELIGWLSTTIGNYKKQNMPYVAYLNRGLYLSEGVLFDYQED